VMVKQGDSFGALSLAGGSFSLSYVLMIPIMLDGRKD